jgi:hypothetical protein
MATRLVLPACVRARRAVFVIGAICTAPALFVAGCGGSNTSQEAPAASTTAADASHEGHVAGKVYFVEPKDGATVSSKEAVKFVFGSDNYTIAAVPEGEVKEVRANMGHFHLGVDKECVPAGQEIVRGQPDWVHFGTGSNNIEMSLTPGKHTMSVQVGDDLHRAVEGLCETISITVE